MAASSAGPTGSEGHATRMPLARHGHLPTTGAAVSLLKLGAGVLGVAVVSTAVVAAIAAWDVASSLKPSVLLPVDIIEPRPAEPALVPGIGAIDGGVNLVLVGSDSGEGDPAFGERSERLGDVTLLLHIAEDHGSATVVSFPRDLFVEIPECPDPGDGTAPGTGGGFIDKMNTSLFYGGLGCTVATVQGLTGLSIPYAAEIEFNGVIEMSNAVGGVPVCVTEEIQDAHTGTFLAPGVHRLQGVGALQFLRTRYGLRSGSDLARIGNQQAFLASLARTIRSDGTLTNPLRLYGLAKAAASNMVLSRQLQNADTMVAIARALADIDLARVAFLQFPVDEVDGGLAPRTEDAAVLFQALAADRPVAPSGQLGQASRPDPDIAPTVPPASPAPLPPPGASGEPGERPAPTVVPTGPEEVPPVVLPPSIPGQTAADHTCTVGRTLGEQ